MFKNIAVVRGGGDIASGTIQKLYNSGFKVLVLEVEKPTAIRRRVCFGEAVYEGQITIEGATAKRISSLNDAVEVWRNNKIPVLIDSKGNCIEEIKPEIVVDGILAKRNLGTHMDMADITIALGPGFEAGIDVHAVIETMRGHNLGRIIYHGRAMENTGVPGEIEGFSKERVIYSPANGVIKNIRNIGDIVKSGELLAYVDDFGVRATIDGVLRGIIREGSMVTEGLKIADIDPRLCEQLNCFTISDKARSIGGAVLEAILHLRNINNIVVIDEAAADKEV
jgi:xanthine dehydrogenase accessory factor